MVCDIARRSAAEAMPSYNRKRQDQRLKPRQGAAFRHPSSHALTVWILVNLAVYKLRSTSYLA